MKKLNLKSGGQATVKSRVAVMFLAILAVSAVGILFIEMNRKTVEAAAPASGTIINNNGASVTWMGTKTGIPPAANGEPSCDNTVLGQNCDDYTLTVSGNPADWTGKRIRIRLDWGTPATDYDMVVRKESNGTAGLQGDGVNANVANLDSTIGTSGNGTNNFEELAISPADSGTGIYYVRAIYYAAPGGVEVYTGSATVFSVSSTLTAGTCALPSFDNYQPPVGLPRRDNAGEPSIGVNWNTGNILAQARLTTYRASFSDSTSPANPTSGVNWFAKPVPNVVTGLDPILFTDPITGRTIGGELVAAAGTTQGGVSDDDLATFANTFQTGGPVQGFDHQTIGGGPPKAGALVQPTGGYPHMFYYASQQAAYATMAASVNGGTTYLPAIPMYTLAQCGGLHGHVKVAPDGTVYLPNKNCGGKAAVVVSEDNGVNFSIRPIPTSSVGDDDPSVAIGAGGRVYVSYTDSSLKPHVVVSDDRGLTWRDDTDLTTGVPGGLRAAVFPAMVAGDNNRAALFFVATNSTNPNDPTGVDGATTGMPDPDLTDNFLGTWYPYMAVTCDGGKSWSIVRADNDPLPGRNGLKNPVQQGVVCKNGTTCPDTPNDTRNLLDFNDATVDAKGRIIAVYADGCTTANCVSLPDNTTAKEGNDGLATLTVIRQRGGMRLFAAFDPGGPAAPRLSPPVDAANDLSGAVKLQWATPDDGGSPLTAYRIYRGVSGGLEQMIGEVSPSVNNFRDRNLLKVKRGSGNFYYRVTAVNVYGESPRDVKTFAQ